MIFPSMPAIFIIVIYLAPLILCQNLDLNEDYRKRIVDKHNEFRANTNATDMKKLRYDYNLEQSAIDFAKLCTFDHGDLGDQGENLFRGPTSYSQAAIVAIEMWYDEFKFFSYESMTCALGEQCGHYLQVVWAKTEFVGCSIQRCGNFAGANFIVCRYFPRAQIKNQVPLVPPYTMGFTPCLNCSEGYECEGNLCSIIEPPTTIPTTTPDEITTPQATTASPITMKSSGSTTADTDIAITTPTTTSSVIANSTTTKGTKPTSPGMPTTTSTTSSVIANSTTTEGTKPTSPDMPTTTSTISCPPTPSTTCSEEYKALLEEYRKYRDEWQIAFENYKSDANNDCI